MNASVHRILPLGLLLLPAACATVSQIQPVAQKFDQGAHSVVTTEQSFYQAVKSADCNAQFYNAALEFSLHKSASPGVSSACAPTILSDSEIALRKSALNAVSAYADKIEALASGTDTALDTSAKTLATDVNKEVPKGGKSVAAGVEAAVIELANIALDNQRFTDIKAAAIAAGPSLTAIVNTLKTENTNFSAGIDSKIGSVQSSLNTILHTEHGAQAYFDAATARQILQAANPFNGPAAQDAADESAAAMAQKLNTALDALVTANQSLATAEAGTAEQAVSNLVARAKDAETLYAALNK